MPSQPSDYFIRPMRLDDLPSVQRVTNQSFDDYDRRFRWADDPLPQPRSEADLASWRQQVEHLLRTDPRGCVVAEDDSGLLGIAFSARREMTWLLAIFAVRPDVQGRGVGRQLLDAAQALSVGCLRSILLASDDPKALRRYRSAGLRPAPDTAGARAGAAVGAAGGGARARGLAR